MNIYNYIKPKSNVYTGKHNKIETKIIHTIYDAKTLELDELFGVDDQKKHYIQVVGLSDIEKISSIKDVYQIDPLILEDIFNVNQRNKIEMKDAYLFCVFNLMYIENEQLKEDYMSLLMTKNTIITFHETEPTFLNPLKTLFEEYKELRERSIDFLFFQILDIITDHHLDVYDHLDDQTIKFEEQILETKSIEQDAFYLIRKQMLKLKNNVSPVLEQLDKSIINTNHFRLENQGYFDDLRDHLKRLDVRLTNSRELMHHLLDLHMNNQSTKMNKIMTTLTIFSAIFIPLSFMTGFFGMNFKHFDILEYPFAVGLFALICVMIVIGMILFFRRKHWF